MNPIPTRPATAAMAWLTGLALSLPVAAQAVGAPAPELELDPIVNGAPVSVSELRGKLLLLDFFATW